MDFRSKPITVRSASGDPRTCVVDCEYQGRGFSFHTLETAASRVQGLTIGNGESTYGGGGVYCRSSSPMLTNCTITGNAASWLRVRRRRRLLRGFQRDADQPALIGNAASRDGGGVHCVNSSPTLANCAITGNSAGEDGGGVYCLLSSNPTLINCTITGNAAAYGGGVCCDQSSPDADQLCCLGRSDGGNLRLFRQPGCDLR